MRPRAFIGGVLLAVLASGCAGERRVLQPISGNEFTLFPNERRAPPPIRCAGEADARFACFAKELEERSREHEVAGALALTTPDGKLHSYARTDALNERVGKITADTRFPAASVSKMFLGAAAVSLSLEGRLDLQRPIAAYLPELSTEVGVGAATLHQLLTHTSGLGNPLQCDTPQTDLGDLLRRRGREPLFAPPGAVDNYSNQGYSFVALVLERVEGRPFEQIVRERVLVPAGIPGASYGLERVAVRGHLPKGVSPMPRCRAMWPSGGLVLSARELSHWASELSRPEESRLGRPLIELLTAPHVASNGIPGGAYGYGVQRVPHGGLTIFTHSGRLEDSTAFVAWSPERRTSVAAFADRTEPFLIGAGLRALSTFLSLPEDWQPPPGPEHPLDAYTGVYVDHHGTLGRLRVRLESGALAIDYLDARPPLLPANFRFVFAGGSPRPRYVVTAVGVGERRDD